MEFEGAAWEITSDDNVLEAACNCTIALLVEGGLVACFEPCCTLCICDERLGRLFWIIPVALGELISCDAKFSSLADGNNISLGINDLGARVRQDLAHSGQACVNAVGCKGIETGGGCLGQS